MKPVWLIPTFLAGALAGALVMSGRVPDPAEPMNTSASAQAAQGAGADADGNIAMQAKSPPASSSTDPLGGPLNPVPADRAPAVAVGPQDASSIPVVATIGSSSIELGENWRKAMANQIPNEETPLGLHQLLEKEIRDDSWSYSVEAEIRNSLTAIAQNKGVTIEVVECRATLCEVRLSAAEAQRGLVDQWNREMNAYPWIRHVAPATNMLISADGRVEQLLILRRPTKPKP